MQTKTRADIMQALNSALLKHFDLTTSIEAARNDIDRLRHALAGVEVGVQEATATVESHTEPAE